MPGGFQTCAVAYSQNRKDAHHEGKLVDKARIELALCRFWVCRLCLIGLLVHTQRG